MANKSLEPVIGLEVHAQLRTNSKIFCGCKVSYGEEPNSLTCPVCQGLPGALPVLNRQAVSYAMRMIMAVGGSVRSRSVFARKNYFYPDLPKGYQISQFDLPVGDGGSISYRMADDQIRSCAIKRIHLEEDAGKSLHPEHGESFTRVDLNRCGTPLIEIVSEPDLKSPEEAYAYLTKLKRILQYLEICTGDMEKGHLRCDANVSVRPKGQRELGTRTEVKNMNSFKGVERALRFEINRQTELVASGKKVTQVTLLWNEDSQTAEMMRTKEESQDYRYFPDPDLVDLHIDEEWLATERERLPELPDEKAARFQNDYEIRAYDAAVLTDNRELADYFEGVATKFPHGQAAANWIITEVLSAVKESDISLRSWHVTPDRIAELLSKIDSREISGKIAKTVFAEMVKVDKSASEIIDEKGLAQISDPTQLAKVIDTVIEQNEKNVTAYRNGKETLFGFFVGQVMKATKGQANPQVVNEILKQKLNES